LRKPSVKLSIFDNHPTTWQFSARRPPGGFY
jgi:hypothetical protein